MIFDIYAQVYNFHCVNLHEEHGEQDAGKYTTHFYIIGDVEGTGTVPVVREFDC